MNKIRIAAACLVLTGCSLFTRQNAKTASDIAKELCVATYGERAGVSLSDIERKFCQTQEDLEPWLNAVLAAKQGVVATGLKR